MSLKIKRTILVAALFVLFIVCFNIMNEHYDELARYTYSDQLSEEQRDLILDHLSTEDINYLSAQQIRPEEFLPFIEEEGFNIRNTQWYYRAKHAQDNSNQAIVSFINKYHDRMNYGDLEAIFSNYSYDTLALFYDKGDSVIKDAVLINDPSKQHLLITGKHTLYTYEPKNLSVIQDIPFASVLTNETEIYVKQELIEPLKQLCSAAQEINQSTCGDLILTKGYVSYKNQFDLYESALLKFGHDNFKKYSDAPGQSEFQLGYSVSFRPAGEEIKDEKEPFEDTPQSTWLLENSHRFGFVVRYPKDKESVTGKTYQPYTLRFVGTKRAKEMKEKNLALEELVNIQGS